MTALCQEIADVLPSLRRYGRAITGDRRTGDRYILVALEVLAEEPWRIRPGQDVKFRLYKLFDAVLSIFQPGPTTDIGWADPHHRLRRGLRDLPLLRRKLLLLVMLERFSVARAAELLGLPRREAEIHLADARARLNPFIFASREASTPAHHRTA